MKFNSKKVKLLLFLGIILTIGSVKFNINQEFGNKAEDNLNNKILNNAVFWDLTGTPIFINDTDTNHDWSKIAENTWCSGNGSVEDPYIIENITIDGQNVGNCIEIHESDVYFEIRNCFVHNAGGSGIWFQEVNNGKILNTTTINNNQYGLKLEDSRYNRFTTIIVKNNSKHGIFMSRSHDNLIETSQICENHGDGISFSRTIYYACHRISVINNNISNNNGNGFIILNHACNCIISGNLVCDNGGDYGIFIGGYSAYAFANDNIISNNIVVNHKKNGITATYGDNFTVTGNTVQNSMECGIDAFGNRGNYANVSGNTVSYSGYSGIHFSGYIGSYLTNNIVHHNGYRGPYDAYGGVQVYRCQDGEISGNNCSYNYGYGLCLYGATNFRNTRVDIFDNIFEYNEGEGINFYFCCNDIDVIGNQVNHNNRNGITIPTINYAYSNTNLKFSRNTISYNVLNGISMVNSKGNYIFENDIKSNSENGIHLKNSHYNTISENDINDGKKSGIFFDNSNENIISENTINYNDECGIILQNGDNNRISENTAKYNSEQGIFLDTSNDNLLVNNILNYNFINGIALVNSNDTEIEANSIKYNVLDGIYLNSSINSSISGNFINFNEHGVYLFESHDSIIIENDLRYNDMTCVFEENCTGNIIENNDCNTPHAGHIFIEIVDQLFTMDGFLITFYLYDSQYQGIIFAMIQIWWGGDLVSDDVINMGLGLYGINLTTITVSPDDPPILLNMTISATNYEDKYIVMFFAVDPEAIDKEAGGDGSSDGDAIDLTSSIIFGSVIIASVGAIAFATIIKKRR